MISQLPPHFTHKEHTLDLFASAIFAKLRTLLKIYTKIKNPDICDERYLDLLAQARMVDFYDSNMSDDEKRSIISNSISIKRKIGTPYIILLALEFLGLHTDDNPAVIVEYSDIEKYIYKPLYDGATFKFNGSTQHNGGESMLSFVLSAWNEFGVILTKPIGRLQQALVADLLEKYKPARCKLIDFMFELALPHDGMSFKYDSETKYI